MRNNLDPVYCEVQDSGSDNRKNTLFYYQLKNDTKMKTLLEVPDKNFLAYLRMNYPEIIKDDSIITNSIEIRNITRLNISNLNIILNLYIILFNFIQKRIHSYYKIFNFYV